MHLNANQPRRAVSPESHLSSQSDTRAAQPVQHLSAFIFISRGAASCHYLAMSTNRIPFFVSTAHKRRTSEVPLTPLLSWHSRTAAHKTHTQKKCSLESLTQTPSNVRCSPQSFADGGINSLKTLYPQGDG